MKIRHLFPALSLLTAVSCQTTTPPAASAAPDRFAEADADRDSRISRDEMSDYLVVSVFPSLDTDNNGKITLAEANAAQDPSITKNFKERDTNKDGAITLDEAKAFARHRKSYDAIFLEADTSKDHSLSRAEVTAYYASKEGPAR
ncbi:MAG: hypothetical protein V4726_17675 [Verrucomicrobiota bacterium]